jgi:hypothetical protein
MRKEGRSLTKTETAPTNDELFMQPWFISEPLAFKLRRLIPDSQFRKMRYYFDDYGCLRCGDRDSAYGSHGMCPRCSAIIRGRLVISLKRRFKKVGVKVDNAAIDSYLKRLHRESPKSVPKIRAKVQRLMSLPTDSR